MTDAKKQEIEGSAGRGRRGLAGGRDWTRGSIVRNLLSLSWPIIISSGFRMLGPTIDMIWVGKLGAASIAGVGVSGMAVTVMMTGRMGFSTGMRAMVARFVGAGDTEGANHVAQQAFVVSAAYSIVVAAIGVFFAEPILTLLGLEADVVAEGAAYMRIMFVGSAATSFGLMTEGIMQASGDAMTPMRLSLFYRLFHIGLCPLLIFGWWIFPRLGVSGAAVTNVASQSLGTVLGLWVLFTGRSRLKLTLRNFRVDLNIIWRIVRIGIPAAIMSMQKSFSRLVFVWFMVPFGTLGLAAHSLCQRVDHVIIIPASGFGQGAGILVGQNLGAQQPGRAERNAWLAAGLATGIIFICVVAIMLWPGSVIRIFSPEPELVEVASVFLRIAAVGMLVASFSIVLQNSLTGAGDTLPPMLIVVISIWLVQMPLALLLPRVTNLGVYGVRWALVAGIVARAIAFTIYSRLGRWKRKSV